MLVYGVLGNTEQALGFISAVDFSGLQTRQCANPEGAGVDAESDFEIFIPTRSIGETCLLGEELQITRRKRQADCYVGDEYEKEVVRRQCRCVASDWECDFGFVRDDNTDKCIASEEAGHVAGKPSPCEGKYTVSSGYRLVPGDMCDVSDLIGVVHPSKVKSCGNDDDSGSLTFTIVAVFIAFFVGLAALVAAVKTNILRLDPLVDWFSSLYERLTSKDRFVRLGSTSDDDDQELAPTTFRLV